MSITKDMFLVDIGNEVIDLGDMTQAEWKLVKTLAQELIAKKHVVEVSHAYIAAFIQYTELQKELYRDFETGFDQMN